MAPNCLSRAFSVVLPESFSNKLKLVFSEIKKKLFAFNYRNKEQLIAVLVCTRDINERERENTVFKKSFLQEVWCEIQHI